MLKLYSGFTLFGFISILIINFLLFPSCKNYDNSVQIRRIDTIINWNNNAKNMLIIDVQAIGNRVDSMKIKIKACDSNSINSLGLQLKSDLVLYNGLLLKYTDFLENYPDKEFQNSVNSKLLDDLKTKIIEHREKPGTLDSLLNIQEKSIHSYFIQTNEIVQNILSVEEMYQRLNNRINTVYEKSIKAAN